MDSLSSSHVGNTSVQTLYEKSIESTSDEPSMAQWSSLVLNLAAPDSPKMALFKQGLYKPGSGEICKKYITMSDSSVLRHVYYNYPCVKDPGITAAILMPEPQKIYSLDGQELYLDLCRAMNVIPVRMFHRNLLNSEIDLKFYGVNPVGVRAMCLALVNNKYVRRLDLTSNHLSIDACYHLGQLLGDNFALQELVLSGCKLGPEGVRQLVVRLASKTIELLDLSKNAMGDDGFQYLANQISKKIVIKKLNLSHNDLTSKSGKALAQAIEWNNTITHLNMSWNNIPMPKGLLTMLGHSKVLNELNFSWTALNIGQPLNQICSLPMLQVLDLSNNRLSTIAVKAITVNLQKAKKLRILNLSHNPLTPSDALTMLTKMMDVRVKLQNLYMEDTCVDKAFVKTLKHVLSLKCRANTTITYGTVLRDYTLSDKDLNMIVMRRLDYITRATKKCHLDIAVFFLQIRKEKQFIEPRELLRKLKMAMVPVDGDFIEGFGDCFPGPKIDKGGRMIDLDGVVEYVRRLWPDKKCPPTPPPEPEPEPVIVKKTNKGKIMKK